MSRISLLVPYRPDGGPRDRLWAFLRGRYQAQLPAWEIVTAPGPDGAFSRTGALCEAAERATGDVFAVADADVWCEGLAAAAARVAAGAAWADPAETQVVRMTEAVTEAVLAGGAFSRAGAPRLGQRRVACGGAFALSRAAFEHCPPDRRFVGWGWEDHAWEADLRRAFGPASVGDRAPLWHLWHPPVDRSTAPKANYRLMMEHIS